MYVFKKIISKLILVDNDFSTFVKYLSNI